MNLNEFHREFGRLEKHFRLDDDNRKTVISDWFKNLAHYHVDAFSTAVDDVLTDATDTFWPALGKITGAIKARTARYDVLKRECATCGGTTWIDAQPMKSNGIVYTYFQRCPDCGTPPPSYAPNRFGSEPLTATEYAYWMQGTLQGPEMYISRTHPLVAQALKIIRPMAAMQPIQSVDVVKALAPEISEPGEEG